MLYSAEILDILDNSEAICEVEIKASVIDDGQNEVTLNPEDKEKGSPENGIGKESKGKD